jgi:hypothetical protein
MEKKVRELFDAMRADESVSWVVEQLSASFAEGVSESAKDAVAQESAKSNAGGSRAKREKSGRENYETSRSYTDVEKLELAKFALKEVFLTLPAMTISTLERLRELGSTASSIEFRTPDEEGPEDGAHVLASSLNGVSQQELRRRFAEFLRGIES